MRNDKENASVGPTVLEGTDCQFLRSLMTVPDLGSRISDLGSRISDIGYRISDLRSRISVPDSADTVGYYWILEKK